MATSTFVPGKVTYSKRGQIIRCHLSKSNQQHLTMYKNTIFYFSCVYVCLMIVDGSYAFFACVPCSGDSCDREPEGCLYGIVQDVCKRSVCASGPGESCGGIHDLLGKCGKGLTCNKKCERCTGCSTTRMMEGVVECLSLNALCNPINYFH